MDAHEFNEKMKLIDEELVKKGVPVHERAFQAFPIAAPDYNGPLMGYGIDRSAYGEYEGPNLLEKIHNWYKQVYGKRASVSRDLGRIPVIIREDIYLIRIPLVYEISEINILPLISGLTPAMARRLSSSGFDEIRDKFNEGYKLVREFEDLYSQVGAEEMNGAERKGNPFLDSAMRDKDAAAACLDEEEEIDTNGSVFHSLQLAEKMLKAVLFHLSDMSEEDISKKSKQGITDIYEEVSNYAKIPAPVSSEISRISQYKTDIRDSNDQVSNSDAVEAYWAGLRIGGFCATLLSKEKRG